MTEASQISLSMAIEAILMVVDEPVTALTLAQITQRPTEEVTGVLTELAQGYIEDSRGFELREIAGGWRFYSAAGAAEYVERFVLDGQQARLTHRNLFDV